MYVLSLGVKNYVNIGMLEYTQYRPCELVFSGFVEGLGLMPSLCVHVVRRTA